MSKVSVLDRIPHEYNRQTFYTIFTQLERQINLLSEGKMYAHYSAQTSAPTTGAHGAGDFVRNSNPVELGSSPNKYVVFGWMCVVSGEPGTWRECRFEVGNDVVSPELGFVSFTGYAPTVT